MRNRLGITTPAIRATDALPDQCDSAITRSNPFRGDVQLNKSNIRHDEMRIKARLLTEFRAHGIIGPKTVVASEYKLRDLGVRADLAVLEEAFIGVEIKSPLDTIRRLRRQMDAYLSVFDKVVLVIPPKHASVVEDPQLKSVEVWQYGTCGSLTQLKNVISETSCCERIRYLSLIPPTELGNDESVKDRAGFETFRKYFSNRYGATSQALWESTRRRDITVDDLHRLRRYAERHSRRVDSARNIEKHWEAWRSKAEHIYVTAGSQSLQSSSVS